MSLPAGSPAAPLISSDLDHRPNRLYVLQGGFVDVVISNIQVFDEPGVAGADLRAASSLNN